MIAFALALLQAAAHPDQPPDQTMMVEPVGMMVAACDRNHDQQTSADEVRSCVENSFATIDTQASGTIGYIQYGDWAERNLGDRNALPSPFEIDANHDNRISLSELEADIARIFARFDTNHDGIVTRPELLTVRAMPNGLTPRRRKR